MGNSTPHKGTHAFNVSWLCSIVREGGWKKMILFSDNEPAMKALKQAVVEAMRDLELTLKRMIPLIRAILSELESKMRQKLDADHHMLSWVARHSARLLTRFRIREDGKRCLSTSTAPRVEKTHRRLRRASPIQACWGRGTKTSFAP